jgi:hypothetical protein
MSVMPAVEFLGHIISIIVGLTVPSNDQVAMLLSDVCLLELPSYFAATCHSVLLVFWLSVCVPILPFRYVDCFKIMGWPFFEEERFAEKSKPLISVVGGHKTPQNMIQN